MIRGDHLGFHEKLQELRKSRNLTQEELARGAICFENCNLKMGIGQRISQY